jgi:acyl-CoA synthetase (AMP-forming)/AMP-acid ligase II
VTTAPGGGRAADRTDPGAAPASPSVGADVSWVGVLEHHARRTPDKPLAVAGDRVVTYAGMVDWSGRLAAGLAGRGVGRGDVVALLSYNSVEFLATIFAANHLGAIAMPINWRLAAAELRYLLEHSGAKVLVCDAELVALADAAVDGSAIGLARVCVPLDPGDHVADGWEAVDDLAGPQPPSRAEVRAGEVHRLMYTSGTTGRPKGVMLTHANLAWKNYAHVTEFGFTSADVGLACGPLYHVGALDLVTTTMIAVGATTIVHRTFDAAAVVEEIARSRVTTIWMAPAMIRAVLDVPGVESRDLSSVRVIIAGGEKLPIPFVERIQRTFPSAWLADAYGLTETVSGDTFLDRDSTTRKLGSVGRACLYLDLEIWDEHGTPVPAGERGEIVLRGPKVFAGYWRDTEATATAFAGGWFHTGDVGTKDDEGYVYVVDRLKDMIVSGGENIAGSEVERVLYEHEAVAEAAVVGRPDERWGEVPVAFVVVGEGAAVTADELLDHCRRQLAKFKVPKDVTFVDALPRNPSGKVLKRELRAAR